MSSTTETSTLPTPPGVSEAELEKALTEFATAIGADKVATDAASLEDFQDPFQVPGTATNVPVRRRQPDERRGRPGSGADRQ